MSFPTVHDAYELVEYAGPWGPERLVVLPTTAGPAACSAQLARLLGEPRPDADGPEAEAEDLLTVRYGVPTRPLPDENAILLLEALGAVRRRECTPESPPRMVAMRYVLEVIAEAWEGTDEPRKRAAAASFYAANERRRPRTLARLDLQLWVPMASLADALYGSSRDTNAGT